MTTFDSTPASNHRSHPRRLVIMISGRGSNMQALVSAIADRGLDAQVVAVVSDKSQAPGLLWARSQGLETRVLESAGYVTREEYDQALATLIESFDPDYVLLAGFMRILSDGFVQQFAGRLVNIHPSLLPAFPGLRTHEQAIACGVQWHGCTVHFVTPVLDGGPIIAQAVVPVLADDTSNSLAQRVLVAEHRLYADVLGWLTAGRVHLSPEGRVTVEADTLRAYVLPAGHAQSIQ